MKKLVTMLTIVCLSVWVAGCKKEEAKTTKPETKPDASAPADPAAPADDAAAAPADDAAAAPADDAAAAPEGASTPE